MAIDAGLKQAYLNTTYRVNGAREPIDIRIGMRSTALDLLLQAHDVAEWAFVTASNPGSHLLTDPENMLRNAELMQDLCSRGLHCMNAVGVPDSADWPPEDSFLILGIAQVDAIAIAKGFGQSAIVFGSMSLSPQLIEIE